MQTASDWSGVILRYALIFFTVAGGLWALMELPSSFRRRYQQFRDWWALRSRKSATKRLIKLQALLVKLNELPTVEPYQGKFYVVVLITLSTISLGLVAWSLFVVFSQQTPPGLVALALVMFSCAAVVSIMGMTQFQFVLESNRNYRRTELEAGIALMKEKLAKSIDQEVLK
jgi:hypothetical protein